MLWPEETIFVDIEFNREDVDFKNVEINSEDKRVRPDIIIHNKKTDPEKLNFLVVKCKKWNASTKDIEDDCQKIRALMENERYEYSFGLQVLYGSDGVRGTLFFKSGTIIMAEAVDYSQPTPRTTRLKAERYSLSISNHQHLYFSKIFVCW